LLFLYIRFLLTLLQTSASPSPVSGVDDVGQGAGKGVGGGGGGQGTQGAASGGGDAFQVLDARADVRGVEGGAGEGGWEGSDGDFGLMFFGADGELLGSEEEDYTPSFLRDLGQSGQMSVRVCCVWGGGWVSDWMVCEWVRIVCVHIDKSVHETSVCARACICLCVWVCGCVHRHHRTKIF
jgi:hypothetical protein